MALSASGAISEDGPMDALDALDASLNASLDVATGEAAIDASS